MLSQPVITPTNLYGLQAWYDASQTPAGAVAALPDLSGNGNIATQNTVANQPICTANQRNGRSVLVFNGSSFLNVASGLNSITNGDNTVFAVCTRSSNSGNASDIIIGYPIPTTFSSWYVQYTSASGTIGYKNRNIAGGATTSSGGVDANYQILRGRIQGTTLATSINNGAETINSNGVYYTNTAAILIGAFNGGVSEFLTGTVAEILVYNRSLSATEMNVISDYLALKWAIPTQLTLNNGLTSPNLAPLGQGITWDGTYYYVSGTDGLSKFDASWNLITTNSDPITSSGLGSAVNHCGDLCVVNGLLYIPMEAYPSGPYSSQYITIFRASDLSFVTSYNISAQLTEISSIAYNINDGLLYISSFITQGTILKYTLTGTYMGSMSVQMPTNNAQGLTFYNGYLWISASSGGGATNSIYKFSLTGTYLGQVYTFGSAGEMEGLASNDNYLIALYNNGAGSINALFYN